MTFAYICPKLFTDSIFSMTVANNAAVGTVGVLRFPPPFFVDDYVSPCLSHLDARWFANWPTSFILTVGAGRSERETAHDGWRRRWKH